MRGAERGPLKGQLGRAAWRDVQACERAPRASWRTCRQNPRQVGVKGHGAAARHGAGGGGGVLHDRLGQVSAHPRDGEM